MKYFSGLILLGYLIFYMTGCTEDISSDKLTECYDTCDNSFNLHVNPWAKYTAICECTKKDNVKIIVKTN